MAPALASMLALGLIAGCTTSAPTDDPSPPQARGSSPAPGPAVGVGTPAVPVVGRWRPRPGLSWQWQLSGRVDTSVGARVFDIDGADNSAATVRSLHRKGAKVICYISAGSWERWRGDATAFPASVLGRRLDGWPGERWLDIRRTDVLLPIMERRIADCRSKGFDGVEPDNVDGYANRSGFPLTAADQLAYNRAIARLAHKHGLAVGLKNDAEQVRALEPHFDFAVVEECVAYDECDAYRPFIRAGKAVFHAEYRGSMARICRESERLGLSTIKKRLDLGAYRRTC